MPLNADDAVKTLQLINKLLENLISIAEQTAKYYDDVVIPYCNLNSHFLKTTIEQYWNITSENQPTTAEAFKRLNLLVLAVILNPKADYSHKDIQEILKTPVLIPTDSSVNYFQLDSIPTIEEILQFSDAQWLEMLNSYQLPTKKHPGRHPLEKIAGKFLDHILKTTNLEQLKNTDIDALLFYFLYKKYELLQPSCVGLFNLITDYQKILTDCRMQITLMLANQLAANEGFVEVKEAVDNSIGTLRSLHERLSQKLPPIAAEKEEKMNARNTDEPPTSSRKLNFIQPINIPCNSKIIIEFLQGFQINELTTYLKSYTLLEQIHPEKIKQLTDLITIMSNLVIHINPLITLLTLCNQITENQYNPWCEKLQMQIAEPEPVSAISGEIKKSSRRNSAPASPRPSIFTSGSIKTPPSIPKLSINSTQLAPTSQ